jgi:tetratricopeptide (TPR) repeat protein
MDTSKLPVILTGKGQLLVSSLAIPLAIGVSIAFGHFIDAAMWTRVTVGFAIGTGLVVKEHLFDHGPEARELVKRGTELEITGHEEQAQAYYERAMKRDPKCVPALYNYGNSLLNKNPEDARTYLDRAVELLGPKHPDALAACVYTDRAAVASILDHNEAAVEYAQRALNYDKDYELAHFALSRALYAVGDDEMALYHERRFRDLQGEDPADVELADGTDPAVVEDAGDDGSGLTAEDVTEGADDPAAQI